MQQRRRLPTKSTYQSIIPLLSMRPQAGNQLDISLHLGGKETAESSKLRECAEEGSTHGPVVFDLLKSSPWRNTRPLKMLKRTLRISRIPKPSHEYADLVGFSHLLVTYKP